MRQWDGWKTSSNGQDPLDERHANTFVTSIMPIMTTCLLYAKKKQTVFIISG